MRTAPGPQRPALARSGSLLAVLGAVVALAAGCGGESSPGGRPERESHSSVGAGDGRPGDCVTRVDALIDSRTIPRADREYAIDMCLGNR